MSKTHSLLITEFHEFQYLPAKITIHFKNFNTPYLKSPLNLTKSNTSRLKTLSLVYILIRTFSKELSSEAINSFFLFSFGYYEKWLFHCKLYAFWKPRSKTLRKTNIFRRPCPKHLGFHCPYSPKGFHGSPGISRRIPKGFHGLPWTSNGLPRTNRLPRTPQASKDSTFNPDLHRL